jgi:hypothetical protein
LGKPLNGHLNLEFLSHSQKQKKDSVMILASHQDT